MNGSKISFRDKKIFKIKSEKFDLEYDYMSKNIYIHLRYKKDSSQFQESNRDK